MHFHQTARLVIEVDGPIQEGLDEQDAGWEQGLRALSLRAIRFNNHQALNDLPAILQAIGDQSSSPGEENV